MSFIMESDHGVFKPRGLKFTGSIRAKDILKVRFNLPFQFCDIVLTIIQVELHLLNF